MNSAWDKVVGVARITIADVLRQKSFTVFFLLCIIFVFMLRGCWGAKVMVNGRDVSGGDFAIPILKVAFVSVSAVVMLVAGLLSMRAFRRDRDEGMQAFILSKPVSRLHYLIGKFMGLWLLLTAFMFIVHGAILLIHFRHSGSVGAGYLIASAISAPNVLFVILGVGLLSLILPDIFAFLAVFGVTAAAFIFDGLARAAGSAAVQSFLARSPGGDEVVWWKVVYWIWPKAGAIESVAVSFIDPSAVVRAGDVLVPLASIGVYCLVFWVLIVLRFEREEIV